MGLTMSSGQTLTRDSALALLRQLAKAIEMPMSHGDNTQGLFRVNTAQSQSRSVTCRVQEKDGIATHFVFETVVCPATEGKYESVLRTNAEAGFGVVCIVPHEGSDYFAVRVTQLISECDAEEVKAALEGIGRTADYLEFEVYDAGGS